MPTEVVKKQEKPLSSGAAKISAAANVYNAMKTKELAAGQKELISCNKQIVDSNHRQEQILTSLDFGMRQLESLSEESNKILKTHADMSEENLKENKRANQRKEARDKIKDLKEELKEQKELEIQALKDMTHSIYREQQTIYQGSMTNLEKLFSLEKLNPIIVNIYSASFPEISDKKFRDETEDAIKEKISEIEEGLTAQDNADKKLIIEIEENDENLLALKLLEKVNAELSKVESVKSLLKKVSKKKRLSDNDFKDLKKEIKKLGEKGGVK